MTALNYLFWRVFYRIRQFFEHWYVRGYFVIGGWAINSLERLDRIFALRITWRYFGQPLFRDFTYIGYFLGFVFRTIRILVSLAIYALVLSVFLLIYIFWALVPAYLVLRIIKP